MPPQKRNPVERRKDVKSLNKSLKNLSVTNSPVKNEMMKNAPGVIFYGESFDDDYAKFLKLFATKYGINPEVELQTYHAKLTEDAKQWQKMKMDEWDDLFKTRVAQMQETNELMFLERISEMKNKFQLELNKKVEYISSWKQKTSEILKTLDACILSEKKYRGEFLNCESKLEIARRRLNHNVIVGKNHKLFRRMEALANKAISSADNHNVRTLALKKLLEFFHNNNIAFESLDNMGY